MTELTASELSNLITACKTSRMREGSKRWAEGLDALALKLKQMRDDLDSKETAQ